MNIWDLSDSDLRKEAKVIKQESKAFGKEMQKVSSERLEHLSSKTTRPLISVWRSREFLCQVYAETADMVRLSVCRTVVDVQNRRWRDGITWDDLQRIKREVGYGEFDAVEIYPDDKDVVNVANLRHLWVFNKPLEWKWRNPKSLSAEEKPTTQPGGIR